MTSPVMPATISGMRKLLVTGASGFLGWNLCRLAAEQWDVTGVYCRHPVAPDRIRVIRADLTEPRDISRMFDLVRPEAVIHAAADAFPNDCERHPDASFCINVEAAERLARYSAERGLPFVFISSDLVFDGTRAPYAEQAPLSPVNVYGSQKAEAERRVDALHPNATICRMPLMFGDPGPCAETFIQPNLRALAEGKPQDLFVDEFRTPVSGDAAAEGILMLLEREVRGLVHLGGEERISRYDFGLLLADVFGYSPDCLVSVRQAGVRMAAARPPDVSLDSSMAFSLGYSPGSLRNQLESLCLRL